jgi:hypothetical protein
LAAALGSDQVLTRALEGVVDELGGRHFDRCISSNRTCELALREITGRPYGSFLLAWRS